MSRIDHHDCMLILAYACALRSTCRRRAVGAVICDAERHILSTGYNGVPSRAIHCTDVACPGAGYKSGDGLDMCHAIHAEQNAIAHCADISRAHTLYSTTMPCMSCTKAILATPISTIIFVEPYAHDLAAKLWIESGKELFQYEPTTPLFTALQLDATNRAAQYLADAVDSDRHGDKGPKPH